jgi:hypothetical protein
VIYQPPKDFADLPQPKQAGFNLLKRFNSTAASALPSPTGAMAEYLGPAYGWETVYDLDRFDETDLTKIKQSVHAYPVLPLIGKTFAIQHEKDLERSFNQLVQQQLPTITWEPFSIRTGAFRKYLLVHFQIPAPPEQTTDQAMGLEIYAKPQKINGALTGSAQYQQLFLDHLFASTAANWPEVIGDFEMQIEQATYSNISYPSVGIPLYS